MKCINSKTINNIFDTLKILYLTLKNLSANSIFNKINNI